MDEYDEEDMLLCVPLPRRRRLRREQKARKIWVKKMLTLRKKKGAFSNLIKEMRVSDREAHFR